MVKTKSFAVQPDKVGGLGTERLYSRDIGIAVAFNQFHIALNVGNQLAAPFLSLPKRSDGGYRSEHIGT